MTNYIIRRLFFAILTFLGITILVYWMSSLAGSPLDALLADPGMTAEEVARREQELGLDQPVFVQYVIWLKELLTGNMGFSYSTYRPVSDMVFERIGATLILTVTAIALSYIVGIPLGMFSALRSGSPLDYSFSTMAFVLSGVPGFFLGMVLIYLLATPTHFVSSRRCRPFTVSPATAGNTSTEPLRPPTKTWPCSCSKASAGHAPWTSGQNASWNSSVATTTFWMPPSMDLIRWIPPLRSILTR